MSKGQTVGYIRVSTSQQNTARQLADLTLDARFEDQLSGKDMERPQLQECLRFLRREDVLYVHSIDRLARNMMDLRRIVDDLTSRGVEIRFVKEGLVFNGADSSMSRLLLNIMGSFAEFEREWIRERQREGIAIAKAAGAYKGRTASLNVEQVAALRERLALGVSKAKLAREFKVSRASVYNYLKGE